MNNLKRPEGLIRTTSMNSLDGKSAPKFRMRPMIYLVGLIITAIVVGIRMGARRDLQYTIIRQARTTYVEMPNGLIANYFQVRVNNQTTSQKTIKIDGPDGVTIICSVCGNSLDGFKEAKGNLVVMVPKDYSKDRISLTLDGELSHELPLIIPSR